MARAGHGMAGRPPRLGSGLLSHPKRSVALVHGMNRPIGRVFPFPMFPHGLSNAMLLGARESPAFVAVVFSRPATLLLLFRLPRSAPLGPSPSPGEATRPRRRPVCSTRSSG